MNDEKMKIALQLFAEEEPKLDENKKKDPEKKEEEKNNKISDEQKKALFEEWEKERKAAEEKEKEISDEKDLNALKEKYKNDTKATEEKYKKEIFNAKLENKIELTFVKKGLSEEQTKKVMKYLNKDNIKDIDDVEKVVDEIIEDFNIYSEADQEAKQKVNTNWYRSNDESKNKLSLGEKLAKRKIAETSKKSKYFE